jgi:hypothetical protein
LLTTYHSSPAPNPSGLRSIQATTMAATLQVNAVWSRTTTRFFLSSPDSHPCFLSLPALHPIRRNERWPRDERRRQRRLGGGSVTRGNATTSRLRGMRLSCLLSQEGRGMRRRCAERQRRRQTGGGGVTRGGATTSRIRGTSGVQ